jgi:hypothetical protein
MRHSLNDPLYWQRRADETRAMADNLKNPEAKDAMTKIAESYEQLAEEAERHASRDEHTVPTHKPRLRHA